MNNPIGRLNSYSKKESIYHDISVFRKVQHRGTFTRSNCPSALLPRPQEREEEEPQASTLLHVIVQYGQCYLTVVIINDIVSCFINVLKFLFLHFPL